MTYGKNKISVSVRDSHKGEKMYLINPLCEGRKDVEFDKIHFPHLFGTEKDFYAERKEDGDLYVETVSSESDYIRQKIEEFEREETALNKALEKSLMLQNQSDEAFEKNLKWVLSFPEHDTFTERELDLMKQWFYTGFLARAWYINK